MMLGGKSQFPKVLYFMTSFIQHSQNDETIEVEHRWQVAQEGEGMEWEAV